MTDGSLLQPELRTKRPLEGSIDEYGQHGVSPFPRCGLSAHTGRAPKSVFSLYISCLSSCFSRRGTKEGLYAGQQTTIKQRTACYVQQLMQHLKTKPYSICAITKRMAAANQFLISLDERSITLETATVAHEHDFLNHKLSTSCRRNGHPPKDVNTWRWNYTSGIHIMLSAWLKGSGHPLRCLREVHGKRRFVVACVILTRERADVRGLAAAVRSRRAESEKRFLESLGERGGSESLLAQISCRPRSLPHAAGLHNCGGPLDNALCCVCVDYSALSISRA